MSATDRASAASCEGTAGAPTTECACGCGSPTAAGRGGWSVACYYRWYRAGKPADGPPPPRRGPAWSADLRGEVTWLVDGGTPVEEAAARVGVTIRTAARYVTPPAPPATCAHDGCSAAATYRRWCATHRDVRRLYLELRAEGLDRQAAAHRVGAAWHSTYLWEPGQPGVGRPRKRAAA